MIRYVKFFLIIFLSLSQNIFAEKTEEKTEDKTKDLTVLTPFKSDFYWGYKNEKGEVLIKPKFYQAFEFSEGIALVIYGKTVNGINYVKKAGYINKKGQYIIKPRFKIPPGDFINPKDNSFNDGLAAVYQNQKYGYINKKGEIVIEPQFEYAAYFCDGFAPVFTEKKWKYINKKGEFVFERSFKLWAGSFSEGMAPVQLDNKKWGYINKKGKLAIRAEFEHASPFTDGLAKVVKNGQFIFIDKRGNEISLSD